MLAFSGGVSCDGIQQSERIAGGYGETNGQKLDSPRLTNLLLITSASLHRHPQSYDQQE